MNQVYSNKYLQTKVQTATPEQLLMMLVDGAIKYCKLGIEAIKQKDMVGANKYLIRTQDIVSELNITLDRSTEISKSLTSLYEYFNHRLVQANMEKQTAPAEEVLEHLKVLRETWMEAALSLKKKAAKGAQYG